MQVVYETVSGIKELEKADKLVQSKGWPQAIPHAELVLAAQRSCLTRGWAIEPPKAILSADAGSAFAIWRATPPSGLSIALGILNHAVGTAKSKTARGPITMFAGVMEHNEVPCWMADHKLIRIQHQRFDPDEETGFAIESLEAKSRKWQPLVRQLQKTPLGTDMAGALLFAASRAGLMPFSRLRKVEGLLSTIPEKERSGWDWFKVFADIARLNPPDQQGKQVVEFFTMLKTQTDKGH